jgi:TonB family protein
MRLFRFKLQSLVFLSILITSAVVAYGQATPDWETLRPEGEEFSVLMPKGSTSETSKEPYHKMELNTRTYISRLPSGAVFAIVSLSGIKSNPALYTELQRINSYVDAFKDLFAAKLRKGAVAKLTLVGEKSLQGNAGREYRMTLDDLNGTAQVYATRKRFYSIVYLNTKKDDAIQEQFLSSFVLPEKSNATAVATQNPAPVAQEAQVARTMEAAPAEAPANADAAAKQAELDRATPQGGKRNPISGGVLNGKAISLPKPEYPAEAKAAGADGVVVVEVTLDEQGNVTEAHAVSGHPLLQQVAVNAALQARFSPTLLSGEPLKVKGVIVYNFGRPLN